MQQKYYSAVSVSKNVKKLENCNSYGVVNSQKLQNQLNKTKFTSNLYPSFCFSAIVSIMFQASVSESPKPACKTALNKVNKKTVIFPLQ